MQELVYEGRREPFANLKDLQNVIRDKWHNVDDQTMRKAVLQRKRRLAAEQSRMDNLFCTFSANLLTDDYCDVLVWADVYERRHECELLANSVL